MELDDLLKEAVEASATRKKKDTLASKRTRTPVESQMLESLLLEVDWEVSALVLVVDVRHCQNCGRQEESAGAVMTAREHKRAARQLWLKAATPADLALELPRRVKRIESKTLWCMDCAPSVGFTRLLEERK